MLDVQGSSISRSHAIQNVGVCGLRYPVRIDPGHGRSFDADGLWKLSVGLRADQRGAHMSRLIEALEGLGDRPVDPVTFADLGDQIRIRQSAATGCCEVGFTWFRKVFAPVSGKSSMNPHQINWCVESFGAPDAKATESFLTIGVDARVKSLCPCSKAISERGAHNQRSTVEVQVRLPVSVVGLAPTADQIVNMMEKNASSPVYALLKREDEKFVTEQAYDNPAFVEDLVRGIATAVQESMAPAMEHSGAGWRVRVVNHESIHAHDCFAEISSTGWSG